MNLNCDEMDGARAGDVKSPRRYEKRMYRRGEVGGERVGGGGTDHSGLVTGD